MSLQKQPCIRESLDHVEKDLAHEEAQRIVDLAVAVIESRWPETKTSITSPRDSRDYFKLALSHRKREIFSALFLNSKHHVIAYEELFKGTIDSSMVYPRVVAQKALEYNAAALIVAHNHPSGNSQPSQADLSLTKTLCESLGLLNIKLLDHIIIGQGDPLSLAELGEITSS